MLDCLNKIAVRFKLCPLLESNEAIKRSFDNSQGMKFGR